MGGGARRPFRSLLPHADRKSSARPPSLALPHKGGGNWRPKREGLRCALSAARFGHLDPRQAGGDGGILRRRQGPPRAMGERSLDGLFPERRQAAPDRAVPPSL